MTDWEEAPLIGGDRVVCAQLLEEFSLHAFVII